MGSTMDHFFQGGGCMSISQALRFVVEQALRNTWKATVLTHLLVKAHHCLWPVTVNKAEKGRQSQKASLHIASESLHRSLACPITHGLKPLCCQSLERADLWILFKVWSISPTPPNPAACRKWFSWMQTAPCDSCLISSPSQSCVFSEMPCYEQGQQQVGSATCPTLTQWPDFSCVPCLLKLSQKAALETACH